MFIIAGITGNTGAAAARALLAEGQPVRTLLRDPARLPGWAAGAEAFAAELTDAAALTRAFAGATAAYILVPTNPQVADPMRPYVDVALAVREAARAAGLPRLVFLSSEGAQHATGNGPIRGLHVAEAILADAAPEVVFLRPSFFQENWQAVWPVAAAHGVLPIFLADAAARRPMIATADIGAEAARLLREAAPPRVVELAGAATSAADVAAAMAARLGKPVQVVQPPREAWEGALQQAGLAAPYAAKVAEMYEGINSGPVGFSGQPRQALTAFAETLAAWAIPA